MSRILIVGLNFHPEPIGIGKYTAELSEYLARQGHHVRVITTYPYYPHWRVEIGYVAWKYQKETWGQVEVQRCPLWVPHAPTGLTRLIHLATFALSSIPALIAQLHWKPDLVICVAPALMNAPFALAFARLCGAKAWLHIQDFELGTALRLGLLPAGKWLAGLITKLEHLLLAGFDKVSSISKRMLAQLLEKRSVSKQNLPVSQRGGYAPDLSANRGIQSAARGPRACSRTIGRSLRWDHG